ncbi:hypothetical protein EV122DRAFT_211480 [Schizophyllum commune]
MPRTRASTNKRGSGSRRSRPRMVYGLTIDQKAMRSFSLANDPPWIPPTDLSAEELEKWWMWRSPTLWLHVITYCTSEFQLPTVNGLTFVWDGDERKPVVPLVDSYETTDIPSDEEVAEVAKYMHQEGQRAKWYQVTFA